jgi:hypothetical protein
MQENRMVRLVPAASIISVALIICTVIGAAALVKVKSYGRTISVTGAAFKSIRSDLAIWQGNVSVRAPILETAYQLLEQDLEKVKDFLQEKGFSAGDYMLSPVIIAKHTNREREITGYGLTRTIRIELADVERIRQLSVEASTLIEQGVLFESRPAQYLFTGLDTLKIEMIRAATENAKLRAEQLARTTGRTVGAPRSARVGVFQIRALHSQDVSSRGMSDVTSIDKEIVSTVHVGFLID